MRKEVTIASKGLPHCHTTIAIDATHSSDWKFAPFTVMISTGSARLQTYATREELMELVEVINQVVSDEMWRECIDAAKSNTGELNGSRA